ncbi:putative TPR and ankyrin repeat-containing protein [Helianthus annuus]|nr:putative TPR and ankyrin repeat-containing protein [Helianthus annuus]
MATLCFERAKNEVWEIRARAYGLRAATHKLKRANPKGFEDNLKAAVEMFESIGEADSINS